MLVVFAPLLLLPLTQAVYGPFAWVYDACYKVGKSGPIIINNPDGSDSQKYYKLQSGNDLQACAAWCDRLFRKGKGHPKYIGMEGNRCFCYSDQPTNTMVADTECTTTCPSNALQSACSPDTCHDSCSSTVQCCGFYTTDWPLKRQSAYYHYGCAEPAPIPGMSVSLSGGSWNLVAGSSAAVTFTCTTPGMRIVGTVDSQSRVRQCTIEGLLEIPQCELENGIVSTSGDLEGAVATFGCDEFYRLVGANSVTCQQGAWSATMPVCEAPSDITNGSVAVNNDVLGGTATYECDAGTRLIGNQDVVCGQADTWVGEPPICEIAPPGSNVSAVGDTVGSVATFQCLDTHFRSAGELVAVCGEDGAWNGAPVCQEKSNCSNALPNGLIVAGDGTTYIEGSQVPPGVYQTQCNADASLNGRNSTMECSQSGQWSRTSGGLVNEGQPKCDAKCPNGMNNGYLRDDGARQTGVEWLPPNRTYSVECAMNHQLSSAVDAAECRPDGTWSVQLDGLCVLATCVLEFTLEHGELAWSRSNGDTLSVGDLAVINCNEGYHPVGDDDAQCMGTGVMSNDLTCEPDTCSTPNGLLSNTEPFAAGTYTLGESLPVVCQPYYEVPSGADPKITCGADGDWVYETLKPNCVKVRCIIPTVGDATYPAHQSAGSSVVWGTKMNIRCADNLPVLYLECLNTQLWNDTTPANCTELHQLAEATGWFEMLAMQQQLDQQTGTETSVEGGGSGTSIGAKSSAEAIASVLQLSMACLYLVLWC